MSDDLKDKLLPWADVRHFTPQEFDSPDQPGSGVNMNIDFVKLLDQGRVSTGFPWNINSGYRSPDHNGAVGGKSESEHMDGLGVDIQAVSGSEKFGIVKWALGVGLNRIGIGKNYVHLGFSKILPQNVIWHYYP